MKEYKTDAIRNIALVSHNGAGKTTFVERLLFDTGIITRMGSVQSGNAVMDFEPEEIERNSSISTALAPIEFNNLKLNLLDTPGYIDFIGEVNAALHVADSAVVFIEAVGGVEVGTEITFQAAQQRHMPTILLVNKMDRDNVRVRRVMESIDANLDIRVVPLQLPIGEGPSFEGVVDLLSMQARLGEKGVSADIPDAMQEAAEEARMALVEAAAEGDDALMEKFFEEFDLENDEIIRGLQGLMASQSGVPLLYCSGQTGIGVAAAMDALAQLTPNPGEGTFTATGKDGTENTYPVSDKSPLAAFVFKTREDQYGKTSFIRVFGGKLDSDSRVWDSNSDSEARLGQLSVVRGKEMISVNCLHAGDLGAVVKLGDTQTNHTLSTRSDMLQVAPIARPNPIFAIAIHPVAQSDVAKLSGALHRLLAEDPTLQSSYETATRETILSGMGDTHLDMAVKKLHSKFGVSVSTTIPKVPYRETITKTAEAEYTHKKQTGGAGQYARVFLRVESLGDDADFEFASEIFGGAISGPFVSATEKGCRQALEQGAIAGYPVKGVRAIVYDGKEHPVDSKEIAFQTAGREGFKKAMLAAGPVLLEPIYNVEVTVPADNMGDVMGDFNSRRARVHGMDQKGSKATVKAEAPLAEMQRYLMDLRSMTGGRGVYSMEFSHYGRVPTHLMQQVIDEARKAEEE
ncbi:MAG: elongation factor G [Anaerolineae bacterium]|nr:elongation factor G [Anaerolineae bacterium]MCO5186589.1 elongation factor G [Anaerolineae bacterium]MCO5194097.1 elongation factor G [Anaerolineae bacterium]MCO5198907.1 elongation factor G [Anaerolineae bacterium]MCO5205989.1 elongation factor G [Anaerolineae bacterium]